MIPREEKISSKGIDSVQVFSDAIAEGLIRDIGKSSGIRAYRQGLIPPLTNLVFKFVRGPFNFKS